MWWQILLVAWLALLAVVALLDYLRTSRLKARMRRLTGLPLVDVLAWANDHIEGAGFEWAKILCEEETRFVVAVIKPFPPKTIGTPPHSICAVAKQEDGADRIAQIPNTYGIGIK